MTFCFASVILKVGECEGAHISQFTVFGLIFFWVLKMILPAVNDVDNKINMFFIAHSLCVNECIAPYLTLLLSKIKF
jgi:hypothetical protein